VNRTRLADLKPDMEVWTPTQGWFRIIGLIRIHDVNGEKFYNWEATSPSRRLCGKGDLKVKTRG